MERNAQANARTQSARARSTDLLGGCMAKKLDVKWFPSVWAATIKQKKVDRLAEALKSHTPYFDTWEEAHAHQMRCATTRLERARKELRSAERHAAKVAQLQPNH